MIQLLLLIGLALTAIYAARKYAGNSPGAKRRLWLWLGCGLLLLAIVSGRLGLVIPVIGAMLAALLRLLPLLLPMLLQLIPVWMRRQANPSWDHQTANGDVSTAESQFLRMRLNHSSGEIGGEILRGRYAGQRLSDLKPAQLATLYEDYLGNDPESATLLRAYLDRVYGADWEPDTHSHEAPRTSGKMSREEACQILGLHSHQPSRDEIVSAHRRLMQKLHPDRGGSDYLAAKINQAKDTLLNS